MVTSNFVENDFFNQENLFQSDCELILEDYDALYRNYNIAKKVYYIVWRLLTLDSWTNQTVGVYDNMCKIQDDALRLKFRSAKDMKLGNRNKQNKIRWGRCCMFTWILFRTIVDVRVSLKKVHINLILDCRTLVRQTETVGSCPYCVGICSVKDTPFRLIVTSP